MLLPSGPANTRCSACLFEPRSLHVQLRRAAGTGLQGPETGRQNRRYRDPASGRDRTSAFEPAETPANCGLFLRDRETSVRIGLRGGGRSPDRTSLYAGFPANREINKEFCEFRRSCAIFIPNQSANSVACGLNSLRS